MTIFQVISNLKHDGDTFLAGSFFEAELAAFEHLVKDGVLRVVEGATSLEHAAEIVAAEKAAAGEAATEEAAATPPDTWGPTKEPVVAPESETAAPAANTPAPEAPALAKFNVLKEFEVTNTESKNFGKHAIGEVIEADPVAAQSLVDNGTLAPADAPTGDNL